ncbi:MAG TPA: SRPBCC family protein [Myxococcaceae bacterium]|nr:SRPBCC family protein [Myxococcaceae bacterium]
MARISRFHVRTRMPVPAEALFAWHERPGAFERLNPPFDPVEVLERSGGLEVGARTVIQVKVGPIAQRWAAVHTRYQPGHLFEDEQRGGPFRRWVHTHRTEPSEAGASILDDSISYALPLPPFGDWLGGTFVRSKLERLFAYRHAVTWSDLSHHQRYAHLPRLRVGVRGGPEYLTHPLLAFLRTGGHQASVIPRDDEGQWDAVVSVDSETPPGVAPVWVSAVTEGTDVPASGPRGTLRHVALRTGHVLTPGGGALATAWAGSSLGTRHDGAAFPWIALEDWLGVVNRALLDASAQGALHVSGSEAITLGNFRREVERLRHEPPRAHPTGIVSESADGLTYGQRLEDALRFLLGKRRLPSGEPA